MNWRIALSMVVFMMLSCERSVLSMDASMLSSFQEASTSCNDRYRDHIDIRCYGAVGDGHVVGDASIERDSNVVSVARPLFVSSDVGKLIVVDRAADNGEPLQTQITKVLNGSQVAIGHVASQTVKLKHAYWGTDSTLSFERAWRAASRANLSLYVPPGVYFYNGVGLSGWGQPRVLGDGRNASVVLLGATSRMIDDDHNWISLRISGLRVFGGEGIVRNTDRHAADESQYYISENYFDHFSGTAISNGSRDNPYWYIERNMFTGENTSRTIDIALAGANDSSVISNNAFQNYRIAIKLGSAGSNVHISQNGFLQFEHSRKKTEYGRVAIWAVPSGNRTAGAGLTVTFNKFGNEYIESADLRILYAAEGSGNEFGGRLPLYAPTTGDIFGQTFIGNAVFGGAGTMAPFVYSYTPQVRRNVYRDFVIAGTPMGYVLEFAAGVVPTEKQKMEAGNICESVSQVSSLNRQSLETSNVPGMCISRLK